MTQEAPCVYQHVENDVHLFTFNKASAAAVDIFFEGLSAIYKDVTDDSIVLVIMDVRQSGLMPMSYAFRQARQWVNEQPHHPAAFVAVVHKDNFLLTFMELSFKSMRLGHLRTASFKELDAAYQWLFAKRDKLQHNHT